LARQIGKSVRLNLTIYKASVQSDFNRTQVRSIVQSNNSGLFAKF